MVAAVQFFISDDPASRTVSLLLFTLVINYILLVSYRLILFRLKKHGALDVRHVAVVGDGRWQRMNLPARSKSTATGVSSCRRFRAEGSPGTARARRR